MSLLQTQMRELSPSAREPLFRRLMVDDSLAYLREKNCIIGFEVDMKEEQELSGFALIAIQKHTIYAFCSDLDEAPKLILFPPIDKLFDPAFELLHLVVIKRRFTNSKFTGMKIASGQLSDLVRDLTPPEKEVDIPNSVVEQMAGHMKKVEDRGDVCYTDDTRETVPVKITKEQVVEEPETFTEEPDFADGGLNDGFMEEDPYAGFEDPGYGDYGPYGDADPGYGDFDSYKEPEEDPRSTRLKEQAFGGLSEVSDFCSLTLGVQRALAVNIVNKALQSPVSPEYRVALAVKLFCKLFDEKKI